MNSVIKVSKAWGVAIVFGMLLAGCGGGGSSSDSAQSSATQVGQGGSAASATDAKKAVLSWSAPSTRVNGEGIAMGELDKYVIRYGQDASNLDREAVVDNAAEDAAMSYTVDGLSTGTWYFTIQVQDINGLMSEPSEVVSKSIAS
ncbi:hypothetical protein MSNKSG1_03600 [Marinobacter santoriniensis NKSG1]|uniref:Fibronectin type-III domain-containing protein n=1 Tax=Marinobacter santoriniensis NKSG1 TaxID=1288826 RepID=M7CX98_9GAMM|nr:fibronectin type III domain-containing protein [Marinobacter santoriniensis]EMP56860.1 hypothetical protein MSNKSG1_03600 [Marinobacter santoriniensis NKSG1]